jgi:PAS domain S-box-containing protein
MLDGFATSDPSSTASGSRMQSSIDIESIVHAGSWAIDYSARRCSWSPGLYALLDLDPATFAPAPDSLTALIHPDDGDAVALTWHDAHLDRAPFELIHRLRLANGLTKIVLQRANTRYSDEGVPLDAVGILVDITSQQLVRRKLDDATAKLMAVWEHVPEGLALVDLTTGSLVEINPFAEELLGMPQAAVAGTHFTALFPEERRARAAEAFAGIARNPARNVETVLFEDLSVEISTSGAFRVGEQEMTLATVRDITRRKYLERSTARFTETMAAMVRANAAIVRAESVDELFRLVSEAIIGGPYIAASVVEPVQNPGRTGRFVARAGPAAAYFDEIALGWSASEDVGNGPFGEAVRTQRPVARLVSDAQYEVWRDRAVAHGIHASLALPIPGEEARPIFSIYMADRDGFRPDEIALFESLAADIALGIRALRTRDLHRRAVLQERARAEEVEAALEGALAAVVATLEKRDPYTSGHEQRVADLSRLIAVELGLEEDRIRGLYLAASVHDIGKISIPAEILTKPTRLNEIEYALIRQHPQTGYDIMRNIPFRWNIAEMVRQHHEYLDGSGYPRGLKADDILLESRIITVADIVESMSAFRPYHRAITLDAVLNEIGELAKRKLDPDVVAACVRIVELGGFAPSSMAPAPYDFAD